MFKTGDEDADDGDDTETPTKSGYTSCACRDCMEIAISNDTRRPDLCGECEDAGCDADGASDCRVDGGEER